MRASLVSGLKKVAGTVAEVRHPDHFSAADPLIPHQ
jgi:hypothetical protein